MWRRKRERGELGDDHDVPKTSSGGASTTQRKRRGTKTIRTLEDIRHRSDSNYVFDELLADSVDPINAAADVDDEDLADHSEEMSAIVEKEISMVASKTMIAMPQAPPPPPAHAQAPYVQFDDI
jgi:hypothetical protein